MSALIVPLLLAAVGIWAACKKVDIFSAMCAGARNGLDVLINILPALVVLLSAVNMLRASGALDALAQLCSPLLSALGIPSDAAILMFLRPISGSGALAASSQLISQHGPDSYIGRCAAVMMGSTETTFYVVAVYFAATGAKKIRHMLPSALVADLVGFFMAALTVRLFFY